MNNESEKLILKMQILNNIIKNSKNYPDNEEITPLILRDILRECLFEVQSEIINLNNKHHE